MVSYAKMEQADGPVGQNNKRLSLRNLNEFFWISFFLTTFLLFNHGLVRIDRLDCFFFLSSSSRRRATEVIITFLLIATAMLYHCHTCFGFIFINFVLCAGTMRHGNKF